MRRSRHTIEAVRLASAAAALCTAQPAPAPPSIRRMLTSIDAHRIERTINTLAAFGTRSTLSSQTDPHRGVGAARRWIEAQLESYVPASGGRLQVSVQSYTQPATRTLPRPTEISNVAAVLPGDETPSRYVVVSGHYDSRCTDVTDAAHDAPGADDDGSGVAAMLEMARVMSPYRFRATLVFMAVDGEEEGLYGSAYAARLAKQKGWTVEGMITNDIIGSSHAADGSAHRHDVRVFSEGIPTVPTPRDLALIRAVGGEDDSPSRELARFVQQVAHKYVPAMRVDLIYRRDRYLRGGDHMSFLAEGYPAIRFTEAVEDFRHQHQNVRVEDGVQYGDLPQFVDPEYTANVTRVNAAALGMMALAPGPLTDCTLVVRGLSNRTTLRWSSVPGAAAYEVVWRGTSEPAWTHGARVGSGTTVTLPLSKDDYLFGVRSLDGAGHFSPVAFPRPGR